MPEAATEVEAFVLGELDAAGIQYDVARNFIHVSCPFHSHSGTKRKLGISRRNGGLNCWVCDKKGHWNEYARLKGLGTFGSSDAKLQDFRTLARQFDELVADRTVESPDWVERWVGTWRGLSGDFLRSVPSYLWYDDASEARRILWPCYMDGRFRGCMASRLHADTFPKIRNLRGLDAKRVLFPFDHPVVRRSRGVCLVEGQFDALRLLSLGVPAVSILGTGNWSVAKLERLSGRGVDRLVIMMDGDEAGEVAADEIEAAAQNLFDTRVLPLPPGQDPGSCPERYVRVAARMLRCSDADDSCSA